MILPRRHFFGARRLSLAAARRCACRLTVLGVMGALLLIAGGCGSYAYKAVRVRQPLAAGDVAAARQFLEEEKPGGEGLPYLLELGLVLHEQGEYDLSNQIFDRAELLVDELYTKSLSKEALSLVTSDETRPYDGEMWERVLINYYRALNYIDVGDFEAALVECRKINHKLAVYADSQDKPPTYRTDAFAQYLTAILYEAGGEIDDAWVSLRLAEQGYDHYREAYGVEMPRNLARDLLRVADQLGMRTELQELRERFPDEKLVSTQELLSQGEIVLFYEEGFVPAKEQRELTIPLLRSEYTNDEVGRVEYARRLASRADHWRPYRYERTELVYLLRIAVPVYPPRTTDEHPGYAVVRTGGASARTELAEDIGAIARQGLADRMPTILFRTILRGLAKYAVTRGVENKLGELAGTLANLVTAVTEKADTRSWVTLPNTIHVARLVVPPGTHDIEVNCYHADGRLREKISFQDVTVGAGEIRFLSHRAY
jgi:hypothetical protein